MSRHDTAQLERARGVAQVREQRLAGELRELVRQHRGAEQTLDRLAGYLDEYSSDGGAPRAAPQYPGALVNGRRFVRRLDGAITQQQVQADRLAERIAQKTSLWQRARADLTAIERMIENRRRRARRDDARREQREIDASAQRPRDPLASPANPDPRTMAPSTVRVEPRT